MDITENILRLQMTATTIAPEGVDEPTGWKETPVPQKRSWVRRALVGIAGGGLGILAIVAAAGAAYETIASTGDTSSYPPRGRLVDIGGYRLHLDCRGEGTPTIVMDAGLGGSSLDWILLQSELARTTRVCTYDRAGMGWSDAGPLPRSPRHIAEELHLLLENGGIVGPYVLVAHSLAGKNVRMFASEYTADVAGMVLVDARSERIDAVSDADAFSAAIEGQAAMYSVARRLGIARLFGAGLVVQPLVPPGIAAEMVLLQTNAGAIEETTREGLARSADDTTLASAALGSMPLVVIAAADSMNSIPNWPAAQSALTALSTNGRLVVAEHSNHHVQLAEPQVVVAAVNEVLASVRDEF